ncbi:MAG TPA: lysophospholipid acyltransferase family protein, partial [Planctomycetota bacterium]|nr:lysophospholipid acyltransferase family protein [Planctomycetota bacterium]
MKPEVATLVAIALAAAGACALFALIAFKMRGPEDTPFIAVLRVICVVYTKVVHGLRRVPRGVDPVPPTGPAILVANHRSGLDPVIMGIVTRRRVRFLMAREYYEAVGLRWMFRALGCIPVNRDGNDLGATKAAMTALRASQVIGIFPQGGIREAGASLEGKSGAALLALRTGAPVVPIFIEGTPTLESVLLASMRPSLTRVTT